MHQAANLFGSQLRVKLLNLLLFSKQETFHIRDLARRAEASASHTSREVHNLNKIGILNLKKDGNQLDISLNNNPVTENLKNIFIELGMNLEPLKELASEISCKFLIIFGSIASNTQNIDSDIDLLVISNDINLNDFYKKIRQKENLLNKEIQTIIMNEEELIKRHNSNDSLIINIMQNDKIFLKGNPDEFRQFIERR